MNSIGKILDIDTGFDTFSETFILKSNEQRE
jgi:hypothetical protein